jgi:hypothetical protein
MNNKYHAKPTEYNGVRYASKAEAKRAAELDLLKKNGDIIEWIGQPKFRLGVPENVYVADFLVVAPIPITIPGYRETIQEHDTWVEDVKGKETPKFKHNKKLWKRYGRLPLHIISRSGTEVVEPEDS